MVGPRNMQICIMRRERAAKLPFSVLGSEVVKRFRPSSILVHRLKLIPGRDFPIRDGGGGAGALCVCLSFVASLKESRSE